MTDNLRGIIAVLISSVAFVLNDVCVKLASDELPSGEIIIVRGVLATAMLAAGALWGASTLFTAALSTAGQPADGTLLADGSPAITNSVSVTPNSDLKYTFSSFVLTGTVDQSD